jgi:hypothetical protein
MFARLTNPNYRAESASVLSEPYYVFSTAEKKRAKVTAAELRAVAATLEEAHQEERRPEWQQYEEIAAGRYAEGRRRRAKTAAARKELEDEWLPIVEVSFPGAPVPSRGTGRRRARGGGRKATPPGAGRQAGSPSGGATTNPIKIKRKTLAVKKQRQKQATRRLRPTHEEPPDRRYDDS